MPDLDLLRSFVSVVEAGGFTRAGERVHRTQSTVSQQIRRLEEKLGCALFRREGRRAPLTEDGERLLGYARRMLALSAELHDTVGKAARVEVVRLGLPDDFAIPALTEIVSAFTRSHPDVRLSVCCDLSVRLGQALAQGELDVALLKREPGSGPCIAAWPERLHWTGDPAVLPAGEETVPLVLRPAGCLYRERAIHALERAGRRWRVVYESPNLPGIQAALRGGLGISLLDEQGLDDGSPILDDTCPPVTHTELALILRPGAPDDAREMAGMLREFCDRQRMRAPARQAAATMGMGKPLAAEPL
ncbi:LysR substrate-binding domain-containing protein [Bordetella genomosp. 11]|uniref:LysR family transcriptional regulator n=1 Tax=Bordetella genomosp. 11 TaxID=1416808 RepID=A0A261UXF8_9BORD|nr:LysR substrate-binding domain-containing protein [Bordetella genomosp. 11]OZI66281.1 LysR family transcriptional regulator [Bordetella genomosp. 11]